MVLVRVQFNVPPLPLCTLFCKNCFTGNVRLISFISTFPSGALLYSLLPNANDCALHRQGTYVVQKLVEKSLPNEVGIIPMIFHLSDRNMIIVGDCWPGRSFHIRNCSVFPLLCDFHIKASEVIPALISLSYSTCARCSFLMARPSPSMPMAALQSSRL